MALNLEQRRRLQYAVGSLSIGSQIADAIDSGGNPVASNVEELGMTSDLSLDNPTAASLNATFDSSEVEMALDGKADQQAVSDLMDSVEDRLDALESKIDEIIVAFKSVGLMSNS